MSGLGYIPQVIEGVGGTDVQGSGHVFVSGSGVNPGSFQRLPATQNTQSVVPSLFWSAPFNVLSDGDVVFSMVWNGFLQNDNGSPATFMGLEFTADVDGIALPDLSAVVLSVDPGPTAVVTWLTNGTYQAVATGLTAGLHTFNIFWRSQDLYCAAQIAQNEANLRITKL